MANAVAARADQKASADGSAAGGTRQGEGGGRDQLPAKMAKDFLLGRRKLTDAVKVGLNAALHDRALVARILAAHKRDAKLGAAVGDKTDLAALVRDPKFDWGEGSREEEGGKKEGGDARQGGAGAAGAVMRKATSPGGGEPSAEVALSQAANSSGAPVDEPIRRRVEQATGSDLSAVRVHTGSDSAAAASAIGARAYTQGNDVHFSPGEYRPRTPDGDHLIAHELVHTIQQGSHGEARQAKLSISQPGDSAEVEADAIADAVIAGRVGDAPVASPVPETAAQHKEGSLPSRGGAIAVRQAGVELQRTPAAAVAQSLAKRALTWLARKGANVSAHILKRHIANRLGKSTFTGGGKFVKKWVTETIEHSDNFVSQGRRVIFEKQFGHPIGKGGEQIVRVVVDRVTGKVITAFPTNAFTKALTAAVGAAVTSKASEADAAIVARRKEIARSLEPSLLGKVVDFFVAPSSMARDDDTVAEQRIVDQKIEEAIDAAARELKQTLSPAQRDEVREAMMLEMQTEPEAGQIE